MIEEFITDLGGKAVLKPLQGSGGAGVFLVDRKEAPNLNQIIEAISRDGYVVAQEYLPEAAKGDVRMFVMNGQPLVVDGEYAAFRRTQPTKDIRSNMSRRRQGREGQGHRRRCSQMVEVVRPKLVADGMFLVGLDIVGDKLMEINVFSPGGLGSAQQPLRGQLRAGDHRRARAQGEHPQALPGDRQPHPRHQLSPPATFARTRCERTSTEVHSDVGHDDIAGCASKVAHTVFERTSVTTHPVATEDVHDDQSAATDLQRLVRGTVRDPGRVVTDGHADRVALSVQRHDEGVCPWTSALVAIR